MPSVTTPLRLFRSHRSAVSRALGPVIAGAVLATAMVAPASAAGRTFYLATNGSDSIAAAATTFVRSWQDFDLVFVVTTPLFLFSATFYPITTYPEPLRTFVEITPLYRGVHMIRALTTDQLDAMVVVDVVYLAVLGLVGLAITSRRMGKLLLK